MRISGVLIGCEAPVTGMPGFHRTPMFRTYNRLQGRQHAPAPDQPPVPGALRPVLWSGGRSRK